MTQLAEILPHRRKGPFYHIQSITIPDSKVHGANMGPIWGRQDPGGPHVGPMNFAICDGYWGTGNAGSQCISSLVIDLVLLEYSGRNTVGVNHIQLEMNTWVHAEILSTVGTDALVLKHQGISIHSADNIFLVLDQFHTKILHLQSKNVIKWYHVLKKWPSCLRVKSSFNFCQWRNYWLF